MAIGLTVLLVEVAKEIVLLGYSKEFEKEADVIYYSFSGLNQYVQRKVHCIHKKYHQHTFQFL